jgi:RNA polymerase sigma-70 factor (ECF subfamily)
VNFSPVKKSPRIFGSAAFFCIEAPGMTPHANDSHLPSHPEPDVTTQRDEPSATECWVSAVRGEEQAFTELFHQHYAPVRGLAARLLLDLSAAEDVAQETFVRAARSLAEVHDPTGFRSWLFRIAANLCRDRLRQQGRRRLREEEFVRLTTAAEQTSEDQTLRVVESLAGLPPEQREAIVLVFYENLSHAEAARIAGCATSTLSWRIMLAKRKLKTLLTP